MKLIQLKYLFAQEVFDIKGMPLALSRLMNVLSIDLESWVHRDKVRDESARERLDDNFIPASTHALLTLLDKYDIKTTFFIVGEIFDWYPKIVYGIRNRGHEIAYHTYSHAPLLEKEKI